MSATPVIPDYNNQVKQELHIWQKQMKRRPSFFNSVSSNVQARINRVIPEKVHHAITTAIKQMTRAMIVGVDIATKKPLQDISFGEREHLVINSIKIYRNTATAEGAITGAGGILLGLADFPIWLTIKMKMLLTLLLNMDSTPATIKNVFTFFIFLNLHSPARSTEIRSTR